MKFSYLTGEVGNIGISKVKKKVFGNSWWLAGGIPAANCIAAYDPKNAASLAASYVNLANPGVFDCVPIVAPTWTNGVGWTFATDKYLTTGIIPANNQTWSAIVRFSGADISAGCVFGTESAGDFVIQFFLSAYIRYFNGGMLALTPALSSGILGFSGNIAYRNGLPETGTIPPAGSAFSYDIYIGALHYGVGLVTFFYSGSIQAIAFYDAILSAPKMAALSAAMAAL